MSSITCPGSRFVPIALLLVLSAPFLSADVLFLKNGQTVEGEVTEKADAYEVKTKYGALTVAKAEVKRRLKDAAALKAEVDVLHKSAKGMAEAGLADDADPAARGVKLEAAATLYERAIALCNDAKAVFTGSEADALAAAAATMTAELARVRAKLGPSTLEPPPAPPAAKPVNPPAGGAIPASIPPAAVPKPDPAVLDAAVLVRNPVPSSGKVRTSEKEIRTLFKDDYAVSTPDARQALARKLLKTALGTKDDPDAQYALLREAAAVGAKATDAATTVFALRLLSRRFAIDVQKEVSSTLSKLESSVRSPAIAQEVVRIYLRANLDAILHDEVEFAGAVVGRAERVARAARDADLLGRTKEQAKETMAFAKEFEAFRDAARKLGNDPGDPAANGAVGEFLCFVKDAWDQGLPYLARGDDKDLKALAADELAKPSTPAEQVALADRWTAWGDGQSPARRKGYGRERAMVWYDAALPGLRGERGGRGTAASGRWSGTTPPSPASAGPRSSRSSGRWSRSSRRWPPGSAAWSSPATWRSLRTAPPPPAPPPPAS